MRTLAATAGGVLGLIGGVGAAAEQPPAPGEPDDVQAQLKALTEQVQGLRSENEAMRGEIDELRAATNENWLTERRAEEIRGLVQDVLADADTRASLLENGFIAGWNDGFFLASPNGRFMLRMGGQIQARWVLSYQEDDEVTPGFPDQSAFDTYRSGFENTRSKLMFGGHIFSRDIEYFLQTNFVRQGVGPAVLEDGWIKFNLNNDFAIRVGQFKLPFNREELVNSRYQLAVERSLINERMNLGYSQGVELIWTDRVSRFSVSFNDGGTEPSQIYNVTQLNPVNKPALVDDVEYSVTSRFEQLVAGNWDQFRDFTSPQGEEFGMLWGVAVHYQRDESNGRPTFGRDETRWLGSTIDLSLEFGGANAFVAFTHYYFDSPGRNDQIFGVVGQGGIYLSPKWEVFLRAEYGSAQGDLAPFFSDLGVATVGVNHYIDGHDAKWTSDLGVGITKIDLNWNSDIAGWRPGDDDSEPQVVLRTQVQLLF